MKFARNFTAFRRFAVLEAAQDRATSRFGTDKFIANILVEELLAAFFSVVIS